VLLRVLEPVRAPRAVKWLGRCSDDVKRLRRRRADSPAPDRRFAPADVRTTLEALQQRPRALRLEVPPPAGRGLVLRTYPLALALFPPLNQG